ncbi:protein FAM161A isoform X1 [Phyllopteryx taeniolatus]|uniref:protein FAM161A isoform X1 n=1 Tax=Phyllopteryx taeniolatus TaxID=161469 RepID=UPI002AD5357D|nr:protein FAM161A isoform X1 [Phyllopteryx taeniolatus]
MANAHRNNVLVTSCLKRPVDPHTRVPLASYERDKETPYSATTYADNRDDYQDKEDQAAYEEACNKRGVATPTAKDWRAAGGDRVNLRNIFFSNEEYYSKLEELKKAHLRTMAELESMYHHKLQLRANNTACHQHGSGGESLHLRKSHSAAELRRSPGMPASSDEDDAGDASGSDVEKGLLFSPKEFIKNMWTDFKLSPRTRQLSTSLPGDRSGFRPRRSSGHQGASVPRATVPKPFQMTLREAERRRRGIKTRSEVELENAELRRQLEEMSECHNKFRASPVPAHVHLPLYNDLRERRQEQRRNMREERHLKTKPFSFLERERLKKEQRQQQPQQPGQQERVKPFKAKPVPRSVYAAAVGELRKEEQLYRSIKKQMRAQEMLYSAAAPPSTLTKRLVESKKSKDQPQTFTHRPHINKDVPDFDASFKRFQKLVERTKEVKPTTACEPFRLRTAQIPSRRERILAEVEKERSSPGTLRWPYFKSSRTANSSLCSSLSGSMELLPAKETDASKKRHEAVRQALERRRRAEQEEERWTERQKEREKKLQKLVQKRASANDPHLALTHTHGHKLQEFRKQDRQRRKEYQREIKEIEERVKGRPLLLEQAAQKNAKQAAQKRFADKLHGVHLNEDFLSRKAAAARTHTGGACEPSDSEDAAALEPVHYCKVFLDDQDQEVGREDEDQSDKDSRDCSEDGKRHHSDGSCHYSDDRDHYDDDEERDAEDGKRDEDE